MREELFPPRKSAHPATVICNNLRVHDLVSDTIFSCALVRLRLSNKLYLRELLPRGVIVLTYA
jgi:hypothetical protein